MFARGHMGWDQTAVAIWAELVNKEKTFQERFEKQQEESENAKKKKKKHKKTVVEDIRGDSRFEDMVMRERYGDMRLSSYEEGNYRMTQPVVDIRVPGKFYDRYRAPATSTSARVVDSKSHTRLKEALVRGDKAAAKPGRPLYGRYEEPRSLHPGYLRSAFVTTTYNVRSSRWL
ncbi:hypothetical protein CYMTET_56776 [Cymbomonas tetramitiformis]|uniref:Uncharacterized protein n=1 Tax=Cymbomonas tetramitiformis TaxID=36881 RepID=A0AAE0BBM9_9CHLO|nr:hypothetical protein CYMTET_56776 [Cymbomonas tetramitiformis]